MSYPCKRDDCDFIAATPGQLGGHMAQHTRLDELTASRTPAQRELAQYMTGMPGGSYMGDSANQILVTLEREDTEEVIIVLGDGNLQFRLIEAAYPPATDDRHPELGIDPGGYVIFTVPTTVGRMLEWYADEAVYWVEYAESSP